MGDRSVDARDIKQSVVVTGDHNNVALTFGDSGIRLPLRRKKFPAPDRTPPVTSPSRRRPGPISVLRVGESQCGSGVV